jgi:hypothetical protein
MIVVVMTGDGVADRRTPDASDNGADWTTDDRASDRTCDPSSHCAV